MPKYHGLLPRTIAVVRMATAIFFLLFGQYKIFGSAFAHGGFQQYLEGFVQNSSVSFFRPFLANLVQPHPVFFAYVVGTLELFIGVCLLRGRWVRSAPRCGGLETGTLDVATRWEPRR